jgi:hypothetical protein
MQLYSFHNLLFSIRLLNHLTAVTAAAVCSVPKVRLVVPNTGLNLVVHCRTEDPSPVLLAWCDNTSAISWIMHAAVGSTIGRALGHLFCALLINSPLGINAKWLSTLENEVADKISRLKKLTIQAADCSSECPVESETNIKWDHLFQSFPQLKMCRTFVPSNKLVSCLWHCLSTKNCPDPSQIEKLKQAGLGKLVTSGLPTP